MSDLTFQDALNLAIEHHRAGRLPEAEGLYRQILTAAPDQPDALHLLGLLAFQVGETQAAIAILEQAVTVAPEAPSYHDTLGQALSAKDRLDEAIAQYRIAIRLKPDFAAAYTNLGAALLRNEQFDEAIAELKRSIELNPRVAQAHHNIASCLVQMRRIDDALAEHRQALELAPNDPTIHYNYATTLLLTGQLAEGFAEYQWRWDVPSLKMLKPPFTQPLWDGSELNGKRILLHAEQGYGDAIQFIRYAPLVAKRGGVVIVCCPGSLGRLLQGVDGVAEVLPADVTPANFDVHCPLLHLPVVFGTTLETIPGDVPYVHPIPARVSHYRNLMGDDRRRKVGLIWSGRPDQPDNRNRLVRLVQLAALAEVEDVHFFSFQFGPAAEQAANPPPGMILTDWTGDLHDFAETAALLQNMDLIVTVDTGTAHLAAALGRPVFMLLSNAADWRWLLDRDDSPWYPTTRLFRQSARGQWQEPIARVAQAMREHLRI